MVPTKKYLPVSTIVLTGKPEGGRSLRGKKKQLVPMVSIMYLMPPPVFQIVFKIDYYLLVLQQNTHNVIIFNFT